MRRQMAPPENVEFANTVQFEGFSPSRRRDAPINMKDHTARVHSHMAYFTLIGEGFGMEAKNSKFMTYGYPVGFASTRGVACDFYSCL